MPPHALSTAADLPIALPAHAAPVCVGYSGGLDSTVLLHRLAADRTLRARGLRAVHVHHGLHDAADAWAEHCAQTCAALGIALRVIRVEVAQDGGFGREAAARAARHGAFHAALAAGEVLALAHHRDDQAETFLLRALRASGPDGLGAMRPWRAFGEAWLWRPLLDLPRASLLAYARGHDLRWIEDTSNDDASFDRNFLRHRVLPLLKERWPRADASFARSAALSAEANGLLDDGDAAALARARIDDSDDGSTLSISALRSLPPARRARVLRRWVAELRLPPLPAQGVSQVDAWMRAARTDANPRFAWHGAVLRRWQDLLHADIERPAIPPEWRARWDGRAPLVLPDGGALQLEGVMGFDDALHVHARRGGARIVLPGRSHSHALKHVLQDRGVPPWLRERLPILCDARGIVVAAGDVACSATFDRWLRERDARLAWAPAASRAASTSGMATMP